MPFCPSMNVEDVSVIFLIFFYNRLIDIDFEPFILLLAAAGAGAAFFLNQVKNFQFHIILNISIRNIQLDILFNILIKQKYPTNYSCQYFKQGKNPTRYSFEYFKQAKAIQPSQNILQKISIG